MTVDHPSQDYPNRKASTPTYNTQEHAVVAIYDSHSRAEAAVKALNDTGFDMKALSIVGKDFQSEEQAVGFYTTGDRIKFWGGRGAIWGSLWGMLFGGAVFFITAIGPLVVLGPLVGWMVSALEGAALGGAAGALGAALTSGGISKDSVTKYEVDVKAGKFLVLARGNVDANASARAVLATTGASQLAIHQLTRDGILNLLSDDEVARVSTAETAPRLSDGDEYLDLEELELGVRRAGGTATPMGRVLSKKSVHQDTWSKTLEKLTAVPPAQRQAELQ